MIVLLLRICFLSLISMAASGAENSDPSLLFFQYAARGTIQFSKQPGCYIVQVNGFDKNMIFLSTSPARVTGKMEIATFITSWKHQQLAATTQPNAILHAKLIVNNKKLPISDVFALKAVTYQQKQGVMQYEICRFQDEMQFSTGKIKDINIFIDPFHRWPP